MLKIIGAGLSRTGTLSLTRALELLGFRSLHFDASRLADVLDGSNAHPDFRRYDDVDAVMDLPTAFFWRELMEAYPGSKIILTVRDPDDWWQSVKEHLGLNYVAEESRIRHQLGRRFGIAALQESDLVIGMRRLRKNVYGSAQPTEFLYRKRYTQHNEHVMACAPPERLLVMDIPAGDGWEKLCGFLDLPIPNHPFPHEHRSAQKDLVSS